MIRWNRQKVEAEPNKQQKKRLNETDQDFICPVVYIQTFKFSLSTFSNNKCPRESDSVLIRQLWLTEPIPFFGYWLTEPIL